MGCSPMKNLFPLVAADDSDATSLEYGLIAGLIAIVITSAVTLVGAGLWGIFLM
jgi:pilus assembly protein Flp/PilA